MCSDNGPSLAGCGQADADIPQFSPHRADMGLFAGNLFVAFDILDNLHMGTLKYIRQAFFVLSYFNTRPPIDQLHNQIDSRLCSWPPKKQVLWR
jgi:hypothetical protein